MSEKHSTREILRADVLTAHFNLFHILKEKLHQEFIPAIINK